MISSESFIVPGFTFRSLIHFEFIFAYSVAIWYNLILLHVAVHHHLLKRLHFLHCVFLPRLSEIRCSYVHGFISGLFILFHGSTFLLLCQLHAVLMTIALYSLQSGKLMHPAPFFVFKIAFAIHGLYVSIQIVKFFVLVL